MDRPNLFQQKVYLDLDNNTVSSDNRIFNVQSLSIEQLIDTTPILEHYLDLARHQNLTESLTLPMIENPNKYLHGFFKFEFTLAPNNQFVWKITDLNTVKENLFSVQQGSNEQEIIKQLFFKGEENKSSILSFIESGGDNYLVRLKKILADLSTNQIEFLPLLHHCFPEKWVDIPAKMLKIHETTPSDEPLEDSLQTLLKIYPEASLQIVNTHKTQDEVQCSLQKCTYYLTENVLSFCPSAQIHINASPQGNPYAIENTFYCDIDKALILDEDKIIEQLIRFHLFYLELNKNELNLSIQEKSKFFSSRLSFEIYRPEFFNT